MKNLDYRNLAALDAVVAHGNFEKAALALAISQSAVSQRIKALEDAAGRLLVIRGQPAVPTGLGQRLISHFQHVRLMENALEIELGQAARLPTVEVEVDGDSLAGWFSEACAALIGPGKCLLDVRLATSDSLASLREGAVFGCVSSAQETVGGTTATALGVLRYSLLATPAFARTWFADGFTLDSALQAPAVTANPDLHSRFLGRRFNLEGQFPASRLPACHAMLAHVQGGLAYGLLPHSQVAALLEQDTLIDLAAGDTIDVALRWHAWNIQTPLTQLLTEQVVAHGRRHLDQTGR
ncbi:MAG TPA: ArgP/LysG family DNA-binding transcriptional regulator [Burkholderiaceae bacterium]